ncbi:MAG: fasciclin domain-containing protein [Pedococcus sp.]
MTTRRLTTAVAILGLAGTAALASAPAASAHSGSHSSTGTRSLATVLAQDGAGFDRNWNDFDIVDNAVTAVLTAKPGSAVGVLADGKVALTAFLPTDRAFRHLASDLTGQRYQSESAVFAAVASLGIDTVEAVLLYHLVPGATVTYRQALRSDGAALTTASGGTVTVDVVCRYLVQLQDADPDDRNPWVVKRDINKGNLQIAHGISEVLRPLDL